MKMKLARTLLTFIAAAALMAGGCATSGDENAATTHNGPALGGPNGSIKLDKFDNLGYSRPKQCAAIPTGSGGAEYRTI